MSTLRLETKITNTVFRSVDIKDIPNDGEKAPWLRVIGIATGQQPCKGSDGKPDYVKFVGQFQAVDAKTGEVARAAVAIFPKVIENSLSAALALSDGNVEMGFDISMLGDKSSVSKYVWTAVPLIESKNDALDHLINALPALSAPAKK